MKKNKLVKVVMILQMFTGHPYLCRRLCSLELLLGRRRFKFYLCRYRKGNCSFIWHTFSERSNNGSQTYWGYKFGCFTLLHFSQIFKRFTWRSIVLQVFLILERVIFFIFVIHYCNLILKIQLFRLNSVVFYQKNTGHEYNLIRFHTLTGPFFSLIHDPTTNHILVSCRPSSSISHVRHLYCQLNGEQCLPIHVFIGGTVQSMLSRPCFFKLNDQSLIAVFQQSNNSVITSHRVEFFFIKKIFSSEKKQGLLFVPDWIVECINGIKSFDISS